MNRVILLLVIVCAVHVALVFGRRRKGHHDGFHRDFCPDTNKCTDDGYPVCAKQLMEDEDCYNEKIFPSQCHMDMENKCFEARYTLSERHQCLME